MLLGQIVLTAETKRRNLHLRMMVLVLAAQALVNLLVLLLELNL
jgi:hypothetical protein